MVVCEIFRFGLDSGLHRRPKPDRNRVQNERAKSGTAIFRFGLGVDVSFSAVGLIFRLVFLAGNLFVSYQSPTPESLPNTHVPHIWCAYAMASQLYARNDGSRQ